MKTTNYLVCALLFALVVVLLLPSSSMGAYQRNNASLTPVAYLPIVAKNYYPSMEYKSATIPANIGGSISLGNSTLSIPAGALPTDTVVTIARPKNAPDVGDRGIGYLQLEPSGLRFNTSATLSISYQEPLTFQEDWLAAYTYNEVDKRWEKLNVISHNTANNQFTVSLNHFSFITTIFDRPLDMILHLPGKYLQKGDLIYALALTEGNSKFTWIPGHAGLYLGTTTANSTANDGSTIIESTPATPIGQQPGCLWSGGVGTGPLSDFMYESGHTYMGARRPAGLSVQDRTNIATFALSKLNKGYSLVGQGNIGDSCYSCVGLSEASYDSVGKSIIPPLLEFPFILPLEQYIRTQPVNEITVQVGQLVNFPTQRVYWNTAQGQFVADSTVSITGCPSGATCSNGTVDWTPTTSDVGDHTLYFSTSITTNDKTYSASQTLTIHAVGIGSGTISGVVVDATTGYGISGATVSLGGTSYSTVTGGDGSYSLNNIRVGTYSITATKSGYVQISTDVTVFDNQATTSNLALPSTAYANDIVVTLTWGQYPRDLDSHLWLPASNPHHIYFSNRGSLTSFPYARLDVDDRSSYGPENITIRQQYNGTYKYAVYNYSGSPAITASSARVTVVKSGVLVQTFVVPTAGSGIWWYVFDYDGMTGNIIPRNLLVDTSPAPYASASPEDTTK